jgi:hypothetical protein
MSTPCTYGLHEVPEQLFNECSAWGFPARQQIAKGEPVKCFVGEFSVEIHKFGKRTKLEFPRETGRGDEVTYTGTTVVEFQVPGEMIPHVPEWAQKPDAEKLQAAVYAILSCNPGAQGVTYQFYPEKEIKRELQWPYTSEEVAYQTHLLRTAD